MDDPETPGGTPLPRGHAGAGSSGTTMIDTKAYGRFRTFSGKEEEWTTWVFVARSYMSLLSPRYDHYLSLVEETDDFEQIALSSQGPEAKQLSWALFKVLVQSVEGRALSVMMNAERSNGFHAWKLLVDTYEPKIGGRWTSMLMGIIGPTWQGTKEEDFLEKLDEWEVQIRRYEDQSNEEVTAATKCAVVMKFAPRGIQTALRTSSSVIGSDYERLKKCVKDYLQAGQIYDYKGQPEKKDTGGPAPMEVGALQKGGWKGKDKGKGKKGKYGDKGKGKKGTKGKFEKGSNYEKKFDGYCSYCYKYGHKKAECRSKARDQGKGGKGKSTNAVEEQGNESPKSNTGGTRGVTAAVYYPLMGTQSFMEEEVDWGNDNVTDDENSWGDWRAEPASSSAVDTTVQYTEETRRVPTMTWSVMPKRPRWSDEPNAWDQMDEEAEDLAPEDQTGGWIAMVTYDPEDKTVASISNPEEYIMYDTGSDEHVCTESFGGYGEEVQSSVKLNAVSGDKLDILGERKVLLKFETNKGEIQMEVVFQVSKNATKNILSGGKLFKAGFKSNLNPEGTSNLWHLESKQAIPLYMYGNSIYIKLKDAKTKPRTEKVPNIVVAPVVDDNTSKAWEEVGAEDPIEQFSDEDLPGLQGGRMEEDEEPSLGPEATVRQIKARLTELGWSTSGGTKAKLLNKLKAAEKEHKKMKERQRAIEEERLGRHGDEVKESKELDKPGKPTESEVARHNLTHMPMADWCEHCIKGKGKDKDHRRLEGQERDVIQLDYSYLKADGSEAVEDAAAVILTAVDCGSGMMTAMSLPAKNFEIKYVVKTLKSFISQLGHVQLAIRTDGEPTILQVAEALRDELNATKLKDTILRTYIEKAPRYSSQSMGQVGARQAMLKGDCLTLRSTLEDLTGKEIHPGKTIWPWLVRHASWTRSRFGVKANRRTAYEDAFGHSYSSALVPFGEVVLFKMPSSAAGRTSQKRMLKGDFSWEKGMFVGKSNDSDEYLLATKKGVHTARTVRRLREELRNPKEMIEDIKGVPWNTMTSIGRPRKITEWTVAAPSTPKPATEGLMPGSKMKMVKGREAKDEAQKKAKGREAEDQSEDEMRAKKKLRASDSSARLDEPELRNYQWTRFIIREAWTTRHDRDDDTRRNENSRCRRGNGDRELEEERNGSTPEVCRGRRSKESKDWRSVRWGTLHTS